MDERGCYGSLDWFESTIRRVWIGIMVGWIRFDASYCQMCICIIFVTSNTNTRNVILRRI